MKEFQLEIFDGTSYEPYATGDHPFKLQAMYRAMQWLDNRTWLKAFPGRTRAYRVVRTHLDRKLTPGRWRKPRTSGVISVKHQAQAYAQWLVRDRGTGVGTIAAWHKPGRSTQAEKAWRELRAELKELGVETCIRRDVDPDTNEEPVMRTTWHVQRHDLCQEEHNGG